MFRRVLWASFFAILFLTQPAAAQVNVRGQVLLPNGSPPAESIRFLLEGGDGSLHDERFTDSNGRFILERLSGAMNYTITVESDGSTWDRTVYSFIPSYMPTPRVMLRPFTPKPGVAGKSISASSGYKPNSQAANAYDAALKEIKKQKYESAEQYLRKAIAADPKWAAPCIDLGALLIQQRNYPEAEKILRQAMDADAKSTLALLNLGVALNRQSKYAEAVPVLREALRLEDGLTAARLNLGLALLETQEYKEAEPLLLRVVKTGGAEEVLGQLYLGELYARTGQYEKSIAAFELYLQKAPNASNAAEVRGVIERMREKLGSAR